MACPTEIAVRLPLDFDMETRGKVLKLIGKRCCSSGGGNFTNYMKDSHKLDDLGHKRKSLRTCYFHSP